MRVLTGGAGNGRDRGKCRSRRCGGQESNGAAREQSSPHQSPHQRNLATLLQECASFKLAQLCASCPKQYKPSPHSAARSATQQTNIPPSTRIMVSTRSIAPVACRSAPAPQHCSCDGVSLEKHATFLLDLSFNRAQEPEMKFFGRSLLRNFQ